MQVLQGRVPVSNKGNKGNRSGKVDTVTAGATKTKSINVGTINIVHPKM